MAKAAKEETTQQQETQATTQVDPESQAFIQRQRELAGEAQERLGEGPITAGKTETFLQGLENLNAFDPEALRSELEAAGLGEAAPQISGSAGRLDPDRIRDFFNPFEEDVVGALESDFERQRAQTLSLAAGEATKAGAFGGSRSGVFQSLAVRDVNEIAARTIADTRRRGFEFAGQLALGEFQTREAAATARATANLSAKVSSRQQDFNALLQGTGLGLEQALAQIQAGEQERQIESEILRDPLIRDQIAIALGGQALGPTGTVTEGTTSGTATTTSKPGFDPFGAILGTGATLLGGPLGSKVFG